MRETSLLSEIKLILHQDNDQNLIDIGKIISSRVNVFSYICRAIEKSIYPRHNITLSFPDPCLFRREQPLNRFTSPKNTTFLTSFFFLHDIKLDPFFKMTFLFILQEGKWMMGSESGTISDQPTKEINIKRNLCYSKVSAQF